ncbi:MAG TPA: hypothetical protein VIM59_14500 [Cellvibrio sp.]
MQVPNAIIAVAAEVCLALAVGTTLLFIHARKLKSLVRRQQEKLIELLQDSKPPVAAASQTQAPTQTYKNYLNAELDATARQFTSLSESGDITLEQSADSPQLLQILALRYAFLRAEELGTTEEIGTPEYWNIFEQTLSPLLKHGQSHGDDNPELAAELETARKRIENLEKFKRLFFDMEKQWNEAKIKANDYYMQLMALSDSLSLNERENFTTVLESYNNVYDNINQQFIDLSQPQPGKTIHITRQDPRAADEIIKLRNVAADQHRIINQLQRKLIEAKTAEDKELVIQELQQQLQRQTRFVQESETCVQLLEDELSKVHQELSNIEKELDASQNLSEENLRMRTTLQSFTLESKDLIQNIDSLEKENSKLKQHQEHAEPTQAQPTAGATELKKVQTEYLQLQQQYAELEEKYLELKLGS